MRYYKIIDNGKLISIGEGFDGEEITKEEYGTILYEIKLKTNYVNRLYNNSITIDEVPLEWQEEIQERVNERILLDEYNESMIEKG